jgi:hypothetical protein
MASAQKSGGSRNSEGTKAEPGVPRPRTVAETAASRGVSEAALLAEFRFSLAAHGKRAEDNLDKELLPWVRKFVRAVRKDEIRAQAWQKLKSKCDMPLLLEHLYLFTCFGRTTGDVLQDAFRCLKEGLDGLLPKYRKTYEETAALFADPKLQLLTVLSEAVPQLFAEPLRSIALCELGLKATREWAEQVSSYKTEPHDFHLYIMATSVHAATGRYHFRELATLIETAKLAHGARHDTIDEGGLKRRVQRYAKRMNLARPRPPARKNK